MYLGRRELKTEKRAEHDVVDATSESKISTTRQVLARLLHQVTSNSFCCCFHFVLYHCTTIDVPI